MAQFLVVPSADVSAGIITSLSNARLEPDNVITASGEVVVTFATADISPPFTPTGTNAVLGPRVISGSNADQILIVPSANVSGSVLTSISGSVVSTNPVVTGLLGGVAYRAVTLTAASPVTDTATVPGQFTPADWTVVDDASGGILKFTFITLPSANGSAITNLNIYENGSLTPIATGLTAAGTYYLTSRTNDVSYSYTVAAVNAKGAGPKSGTKSATPTVSGGTAPISNMDPDIVLTSVAQINATLTSWAADPAGTAPSGKGALQDRVIGISTILNGLAISSKNMPMKVFIRPVGSYSEAVINGYKIPACSVYVNGGVALTGCTNIHLWRMDVRAANGTTGYGTGLVHLSGCTRCGFIRSVARGWPHALVQGTYGTTAVGVRVTGGSDNIVEYSAVFFAYDTDYSLFGTSQRFTWRGCTARHSGGNQFKLATGSVANDMVHEFCLQDRAYHPYKGLHGDYMQWNNGAIANRYNIRKSIMYHGHWTGEYNPNSNGTGVSNATQTIFSSPGGTTTAGDQNIFEDCLVVSSQSRGLDRMPGPAILTAQNSSFIDSLMPLTPIKQTGSSPWPRIIAVDVSIANYVTLQLGNSGMIGNEGAGGIALRVSPDHHEILDDHVSIPTDLTDLYDIRPVSGRRTDPLYSTPSQRVGAFKLWSDLYLGDNRIVLSKQGWPVATVFKEDFDPLNRFGGTHSGNYDSNGDSI